MLDYIVGKTAATVGRQRDKSFCNFRVFTLKDQIDAFTSDFGNRTYNNGYNGSHYFNLNLNPDNKILFVLFKRALLIIEERLESLYRNKLGQ